MRKNGKIKYKKCDIIYSVYGENAQYGSSGSLIVHAEKVMVHELPSDQIYNSSAEAEKQVIKKAKSILDHLIDIGKYKPIN